MVTSFFCGFKHTDDTDSAVAHEQALIGRVSITWDRDRIGIDARHQHTQATVHASEQNPS